MKKPSVSQELNEERHREFLLYHHFIDRWEHLDCLRDLNSLDLFLKK